MTQKFSLIIALVTSLVSAQSVYKGTIGTERVQLVTEIDNSGAVSALLIHESDDTPCKLSGSFKGETLKLYSGDKKSPRSEFEIKNVSCQSWQIKGEYSSKEPHTKLPICLVKDYEIPHGKKIFLTAPLELLQSESTDRYYFKLIVTKEENRELAKTCGVSIYEKQTDRLIQKIKFNPVDTYSLNSIKVRDINGDARIDFQVYAGLDATFQETIHSFVQNPETGMFIPSNVQLSANTTKTEK